MDKHFFYIAAAYAVCLVTLLSLTITTIAAWRAVKKELDE